MFHEYTNKEENILLATFFQGIDPEQIEEYMVIARVHRQEGDDVRHGIAIMSRASQEFDEMGMLIRALHDVRFDIPSSYHERGPDEIAEDDQDD